MLTPPVSICDGIALRLRPHIVQAGRLCDFFERRRNWLLLHISRLVSRNVLVS